MNDALFNGFSPYCHNVKSDTLTRNVYILSVTEYNLEMVVTKNENRQRNKNPTRT